MNNYIYGRLSQIDDEQFIISRTFYVPRYFFFLTTRHRGVRMLNVSLIGLRTLQQSSTKLVISIHEILDAQDVQMLFKIDPL